MCWEALFTAIIAKLPDAHRAQMMFLPPSGRFSGRITPVVGKNIIRDACCPTNPKVSVVVQMTTVPADDDSSQDGMVVVCDSTILAAADHNHHMTILGIIP